MQRTIVHPSLVEADQTVFVGIALRRGGVERGVLERHQLVAVTRSMKRPGATSRFMICTRVSASCGGCELMRIDSGLKYVNPLTPPKYISPAVGAELRAGVEFVVRRAHC